MKQALSLLLICFFLQAFAATQTLTIYESVPQYGATDIAQDPKITIQFTKPITLVKKTTVTNPLFYVQIGTQVPVSFTAEQAVTTVGRTTIVIDLYEALHASLPASTRIRFYFGTGLSTPVVADDGSTLIQAPFMDGETPRSYLTFYTGEEDIPELLYNESSPALHQNNFDVTANLRFVYSTTISLGYGTITVVPINQPDYILSYDVRNPEEVELAEDHVSLILKNKELIGTQQYYVYMPYGVVKGETGTPSALVPATLYTFTTAVDSVKPSIRAISPVSGSMNLPTNPTFVITFTKNIIPNTGLITFVGSKNTYSINVLSKEVQCKFNTCVIKPQTPFELGSYFMSFNTNAFRDTSDNLLAYNCNDYVFNVSGNACQLEYLKGGLGDTCNCMSTPTQCQCNCGETIFIKNY